MNVVFRFAPAESSQRDLLHRWFEQKHIKEWMHGLGLQNTLNGLEKFRRRIHCKLASCATLSNGASHERFIIYNRNFQCLKSPA